jgi:5-methylcytosine-specific restriction enzyme A
MFTINKSYSKQDIYEILEVPENKRRGAWDTGYRMWSDSMFIFANVGIPGRTGIDYKNYWDGDQLVWYTKPNGQQFEELISEKITKFLFTRSDDRSPFTFEGKVKPVTFTDDSPRQIVWEFLSNQGRFEETAEEAGAMLFEGAVKVIKVNKYERNVEARRRCIEFYGCYCQVCGFDFSKYGELGQGYIHVHHLILISTIGQLYEVDPINDLRPVCANCHAMIHLRNPPYSIEDMKRLIVANIGSK